MTAESILNLVSTLAVLAGVIFGVLQLRQFERGRRREGAVLILNSLQTEEFLRGLRVLGEIPPGLDKTGVEARGGPGCPLPGGGYLGADRDPGLPPGAQPGNGRGCPQRDDRQLLGQAAGVCGRPPEAREPGYRAGMVSVAGRADHRAGGSRTSGPGLSRSSGLEALRLAWNAHPWRGIQRRDSAVLFVRFRPGSFF